jgi:uncharacterized membrane protein
MSPAKGGGTTLPIGPVQVLVVGFDDPQFTGEILPELKRLKDADIVRLVDLLLVKKDAEGNVETVQHSDLTKEEAEEFGAVVGALIGLGMGGDDVAVATAQAGAAEAEDGHILSESEVWYLGDALPEKGAAAVALLEHRWAIPLRDKIARAGGSIVEEEWISAESLIALGLKAAAKGDGGAAQN